MKKEVAKPVVISKAYARYVRISPFKVRRVVREIKGKLVDEALRLLELTQHVSSSRVLHKVLHSARANARNNQKFEGALRLTEVQVDQALIMKRVQARSRGRAFPIKKRLSHIAVVLTADQG